jgi:hypothetical protein
VRRLIGSDWIGADEAERWLRRIGTAAVLAGVAAYPARSNIFAVLSAPTAGHILRRIEQKSESGSAGAWVLPYLDALSPGQPRE